MSKRESRKARGLLIWMATLALASVAAILGAAPAGAAEPDFSFDLPAGLACAGFDLHVEGHGDNRIMREFTDKNGNLVRTLAAGRGYDLTFVNLATNEKLELPSNGSVTRTSVNADGTTTVDSTGHNVLILFPTDVPAGPSTILYVGRLVYTVDANEVFTVQKVSARKIDLCALLG